MKKFIKWLAEITGAAQQVREETCREVGYNMQQYAYWFTGGIMVEGHKYDMSNILHEYPKWCLNHGSPHLYGNQFIALREKLWKISDRKESILINNNGRTDNKI